MPPPAPGGGGGGGGERQPRSKPQSPLRITHDGEFYARLLTKESSLGNPSFRYYGAGPGAVPFVWESQPGTPKDAYCSRMLAGAGAVAPAITPPPSYHLRAGAAGPHGHGSRRHGKAGRGAGGRLKYCGYKLNKWIKVGFIATVFRRLAFSKSRSSSSSSSSSSAASVQSSSSTRWLISSSNAGAEARDREYCYAPPTPAKRVLCLGVRSSPWVLQFCGGRRDAGLPAWVYGWRP